MGLVGPDLVHTRLKSQGPRFRRIASHRAMTVCGLQVLWHQSARFATPEPGSQSWIGWASVPQSTSRAHTSVTTSCRRDDVLPDNPQSLLRRYITLATLTRTIGTRR